MGENTNKQPMAVEIPNINIKYFVIFISNLCKVVCVIVEGKNAVDVDMCDCDGNGV